MVVAIDVMGTAQGTANVMAAITAVHSVMEVTAMETVLVMQETVVPHALETVMEPAAVTGQVITAAQTVMETAKEIADVMLFQIVAPDVLMSAMETATGQGFKLSAKSFPKLFPS